MELERKQEENLCEFVLNGKFTFSDNQIFKEIIEHLKSRGSSSVIINMASVSFIDSAAIGMLLLAKDEATNNTKALRIKGLSGQPKKMFDISKLGEVFLIV